MASHIQPPHQAPDLKVDTRTSGQGLGEISGNQTDGKPPNDLVAKAADAAVEKEGENGHRSKSSLVNGWRYLNKDGKCFTREPLKIAIAGGGASGICVALKLLQAQTDGSLGDIDITIYERDQGTPIVIRDADAHPGDNASHVYQFSFAPYADWPQFYSSSCAINKYMHIVAQKFGVEPLIKCNRTIKSAICSEERCKWTLEVEGKDSDMETVEADIYINATGFLSQVNRPHIPGLEDFPEDRVLHTAEWPVDLDYETAFKDENVAVVGNGSSGLQTIGAIAPFAKSVSVFARSKFWTSPPYLAERAGIRDWKGGNFDYSAAEKEEFATNEDALYKHGADLSEATMHLFDIFVKHSAEQEGIKAIIRELMTADLRDPELIAKLVPDFDVWCRRVTPCVPFMEAIHLPTVSLTVDPIDKVTEHGITTKNGQEFKVDRIILATGFDTSFKPRFPVQGKKGVDLRDIWSVRPKGQCKPRGLAYRYESEALHFAAYMALAVAGFPNMFIMCGPGGTFANGAVLPGMEANAKYIVDAIAKMQSQDIRSMEIAQENQDEYNRQQESVMADLVFTTSCSSWYKGGRSDGPPDALFAGSTLQYMELLASPRWEDWKYEYRHENRYSFLGKGTSSVEARGGNRAFYLDKDIYRNPLRESDYRVPTNGAIPVNI
ncbi:hypothetical protein QFC22_006260 [Naganishia vaughanmartiniae]|uniref:Uncharacterized protein n=1 Tax=Naganishia vaughanmartiniae TaxID=1424756 RepID=A0ACC2WNY4_9TREE|nr:hypothetical protein QFC22_006260 [Naganishia vaughanmartiniae]